MESNDRGDLRTRGTPRYRTLLLLGALISVTGLTVVVAALAVFASVLATQGMWDSSGVVYVGLTAVEGPLTLLWVGFGAAAVGAVVVLTWVVLRWRAARRGV